MDLYKRSINNVVNLGYYNKARKGVYQSIIIYMRNAFRTIGPPFPIHNPPKTTTSNADNDTSTATTTMSTTIVFNRSCNLTPNHPPNER